jgi:hypothetical protein
MARRIPGCEELGRNAWEGGEGEEWMGCGSRVNAARSGEVEGADCVVHATGVGYCGVERIEEYGLDGCRVPADQRERAALCR